MAVAKTSYASPATDTAAFFDALPDELALKIVTMAATKLYVLVGVKKKSFPMSENIGCCYAIGVDHDFLLEVLFRVSQRFRRLAKDPYLWKDDVIISQNASYPGKADFVVRQCFHRGTRRLFLRGEYDHEDGARMIICGDPVSMFPSLNFIGVRFNKIDGERMLVWKTRHEEESHEETA